VSTALKHAVVVQSLGDPCCPAGAAHIGLAKRIATKSAGPDAGQPGPESASLPARLGAAPVLRGTSHEPTHLRRPETPSGASARHRARATHSAHDRQPLDARPLAGSWLRVMSLTTSSRAYSITSRMVNVPLALSQPRRTVTVGPRVGTWTNATATHSTLDPICTGTCAVVRDLRDNRTRGWRHYVRTANCSASIAT